MDTPGIAFWIIAATFLAAGLVKGITGMGLPTVAMALLGLVMPPAAAAAMLLVPSFVTNLWQLTRGPRMADLWRRLWPMMAGIAVGTAGSAFLLATADPVSTGAALGAALMIYAGHALTAPPLSVPARCESVLSPIVGVLTGVITGVTGVFVVPAVPYLQALGLERDALVQALGLSFTVSTLALAAGLWRHGAFEAAALASSSWAVAPALAGMWLGQAIRSRIAPAAFRRCFLLSMLVLGAELASRPLR